MLTKVPPFTGDPRKFSDVASYLLHCGLLHKADQIRERIHKMDERHLIEYNPRPCTMDDLYRKDHEMSVVPNAIQLTPNFKLWEFQDPETQSVSLHPLLPYKMQKIRDIVGHSIIITSACRSWNHHLKVYQRYHPNDWEDLITLDSYHLITPPPTFYHRKKLHDRLTRFWVGEHRSKWICCAVDFACVEVPVDRLEEVASCVEFDFIKRYDWGLHVDLRNDLA